MIHKNIVDFFLTEIYSRNTMELNAQFEEAAAKSKQMTRRPTNEELLRLYALYKQGSEGDATGDRPGGFDFKAIAKFDAWEELKGMSKDKAKEEYVSFVNKLLQQYA
jgi:diazepam-binding inhibitor (GABA receptor modulator, acyl-CoA-binding protein)